MAMGEKREYWREVQPGLKITTTKPGHVHALEALQRIVFPDLADQERFRAEHYLRHLELFPEGQFVATALVDSTENAEDLAPELLVEGEEVFYVVGMTSTLRTEIDCEHHHTFDQMVDGGWFTAHDPQGPWMYGADIGVHPSFRRRGLAKAIYQARHEACEQLGLQGQVTVGMINGYGAVADQLTPEEYYQKLLDNKLKDPTVSAQIKVGFQPRGLVRDYLNDPTCGNCGVLLVWPLR